MQELHIMIALKVTLLLCVLVAQGGIVLPGPSRATKSSSEAIITSTTKSSSKAITTSTTKSSSEAITRGRGQANKHLENFTPSNQKSLKKNQVS